MYENQHVSPNCIGVAHGSWVQLAMTYSWTPSVGYHVFIVIEDLQLPTSEAEPPFAKVEA